MNRDAEPLGDSGPALNAVEVETADGIWMLIYSEGPDFSTVDTTFVPAALIEQCRDVT
ncbi:hypothetical protein ACFYZ9_35190 [Streptomyces sp. NPDC001691]|uniref:hypothetical protein n=1 Tax=Streptomyces sp. NPDC001691 TaxID=3364600 RepID=UPI0036B46E63